MEPKFQGIMVTYGKCSEPKPLQEIGEILYTETNEKGFYVIARYNQTFLDWLERVQAAKQESEVKPRWYHFTRIKKLLSRN